MHTSNYLKKKKKKKFEIGLFQQETEFPCRGCRLGWQLLDASVPALLCIYYRPAARISLLTVVMTA
jgi:hypothetical protein